MYYAYLLLSLICFAFINILIFSFKDTLVDDVAPPKHLDAMKIDRDGKVNSNFHKEVFLGEDVKNFENGNYELKAKKDKLEKIFHTYCLLFFIYF